MQSDPAFIVSECQNMLTFILPQGELDKPILVIRQPHLMAQLPFSADAGYARLRQRRHPYQNVLIRGFGDDIVVLVTSKSPSHTVDLAVMNVRHGETRGRNLKIICVNKLINLINFFYYRCDGFWFIL